MLKVAESLKSELGNKRNWFDLCVCFQTAALINLGGIMKKALGILSTLILVALSISGCATTDILQSGTGGYSFEVRGKTYDEIWNAISRAASRDLTIIESNKPTGTFKAEKDLGTAKWSEVVGVLVRPTSHSASVYTIKVLTLNHFAVQLTGQDLASEMVAEIKADLNQ